MTLGPQQWVSQCCERRAEGLGESVQQPQGACDRGLNERGPLL